MTLVEKLFEHIPGAEQVLNDLKNAFSSITPVTPWFNDIKIEGLYIYGSNDLVLGCRIANARGFGTFRQPDSSMPGLIIYPFQGHIHRLRLESGLSGGCVLKKSSEESALVMNLNFVGDYMIPYYSLLNISYRPHLIN